MKMRRFGRQDKTGLLKSALAVTTLALVLALGAGPAVAQEGENLKDVTLEIDAPAEFNPGGTIDVTLTLNETAGSGTVRALGVELMFPAPMSFEGEPAEGEAAAAWDLVKNPDTCEPMVSGNQTAPAPTVQVRTPQPVVDPDTGECNPFSSPIELFWADLAEGEGGLMEDLQFPVTATLTFEVPAGAEGTGAADLTGIVRFRIDTEEEENNEMDPAMDTVSEGPPVGCPLPGDANEDGNVTPADAQDTFEVSIFTPGVTINEDCGDCNGDDNITPADAQGIFEVSIFTPGAECLP